MSYATEAGAMPGISMAVMIPLLILLLIAVIAQWKVYAKGGQPGIACIIPVWNFIALLAIVGRPWTHLFLMLIPVYNIYLVIKIYVELCRSFGKSSVGHYLLMIFFGTFYMMYLGFSGSVKYAGPAHKKAAAPAPPQQG